MNSSNSVVGLSPSIAPPTRSIVVLLADGSRLRVTCRDLATQLRQERSATLTRLRQARAHAKADVADRIGEARIRREFEAGEREMDAAIRRLSKQVRIKPERRCSSSSARPSRSTSARRGHSGVMFTVSTTSALARRDRLGREGLMLRIRYVRAGGKHASPGCLRRHWHYIARQAAVTIDSEGREIVLSNLGETIDDVADSLGLQEQVLREMRKNAKLGFRMIGAFPYGMPVDARREVLQRLGDELFGARDLPWSAAAHDADQDAKVDNPHFHLDYGLLSMARQTDGSFVISNDLRTDLDGQEGLRFIRHIVARVMTEVAQEYGLDRSFTALSYRERGMERDGGEHVGQEGTAAHRRGEHVASIARNEARQRRAVAREKARRAHERVDALEQLKRAVIGMPAPPNLSAGSFDISEIAGITPVAAPAVAVVDAVVLTDTLANDTTSSLLVMGAGPVMTYPAIADAGHGGPATLAVPPVTMADLAPTTPLVPSLTVMPPAGPDIGDEVPRFSVDDSAALPAHARLMIAPPANIELRGVPTPVVLPCPADISSDNPAAAPSLNGCDSGSVAVIVGAPRIGDQSPSILPLSGSSVPIARLPIVLAIGSGAPVTAASPPVAMLGDPAPRMTTPALLLMDAAPTPELGPIPPLVEQGNAVSRIDAPPAITRVGEIVHQPPTIAPNVWSIGRAASDDVADRETAKRLKDLLDEHELRHRNSIDAASAVHAAAFEVLRRRDEWLGQDERGQYTVSDEALRASGLSRADLATPAAQAALEAIGFAQVDRLEPVLDDRSRNPVIHIDDGVVHLDERFSQPLRDDVARWSASPYFRAFVGQVWPQLRSALGSPSAEPTIVSFDTEEHRQQDAPASTPAKPPVELAQVAAFPPASPPSRQRLLILAAEQRTARTKRWEQSRRYDSIHADAGRVVEPVAQQPSSMLPSGSTRRQLALNPGQGR